ncbi:hypothetical protein [Actinocatenispora sera]|uniref:hypothetical protein n=1 Tax=Actinocatenispora sera TaxID=390989 RepID=UPI0012ED03F1|nr:hypothetical protein [Actinocatenispora sera]
MPMKLSGLRVLLDFYQVTDTELRSELLTLQKLGNQRGCRAGLGTVTSSFSTFLGLESAATRISIFDAADGARTPADRRLCASHRQACPQLDTGVRRAAGADPHGAAAERLDP